jgi:hypothetical protein
MVCTRSAAWLGAATNPQKPQNTHSATRIDAITAAADDSKCAKFAEGILHEIAQFEIRDVNVL